MPRTAVVELVRLEEIGLLLRHAVDVHVGVHEDADLSDLGVVHDVDNAQHGAPEEAVLEDELAQQAPAGAQELRQVDRNVGNEVVRLRCAALSARG